MKKYVVMGLALCALVAMPVLLLASVGGMDPVEATQLDDGGDGLTVGSAHVAVVMMAAHMGGTWVEVGQGERYTMLGECVVGVSASGDTVVMSAGRPEAPCWKSLTSAVLGIEPARRVMGNANTPCTSAASEAMGRAHVRSCTTEHGTAQVIVSSL